MKPSNNNDTLTFKDFGTDQDIKWCPGCGDYSILKQVQSVLPTLGVPREKIAFISGIGCSSRYPYYMNTYGIHGIHGRAPAIASGLKAARPDLDIWLVTGDGDAMSIGGNHLIHLLRRNFNLNVLLFNNEIYGLTKGQYSPTSPKGKISKSTPMGSLDHPFNPVALALGAEGTFIARSIDRNPQHLKDMITKAHKHHGTSFIEIYQNCMVFNDKAFERFSDKKIRDDYALFLKAGEPLIFGKERDKGIKLDGFDPKVVDLNDGYSPDDCWIHDPSDKVKASILSNFFDYTLKQGELPRPFGVFYEQDRYTYDDLLEEQVHRAEDNNHDDLDALLSGENHWTVT